MIPARFTGGAVAAAAFAVVLAACGGASSPTATPKMSGMGGMGEMSMQPGAANMNVKITSPASGTVITANSFDVAVTTSGYDDTCDLAGKADEPGKGHYHINLDNELVNMFCTPTATISLQNVKAGMHKISAIPAQDDHAEVEANTNSITIDYEPTSPLPTIAAASFPAKPSIRILSPQPGAVVSGSFDVTVQIQNFNNNCELFGKPPLAGYGHWHAAIDTPTGGAMGMGTMLGMSCTNTFHATTAGLTSGSRHMIYALLVDDTHSPLSPLVDSMVQVTIG